MQIANKHILECPEHGLFYSPDYWPCPFCFNKEHIKEGPACWNTTVIDWKGRQRSLTLAYVPTDDQTYGSFVIYKRKTL